MLRRDPCASVAKINNPNSSMFGKTLVVTPQSRGNPRSGRDAGALAGSRRKAGIFPKFLSA